MPIWEEKSISSETVTLSGQYFCTHVGLWLMMYSDSKIVIVSLSSVRVKEAK